MKNNVRIVGTFEYQDGKFVTVDQNRRTFEAHKPVLIPASQIKNYYPLKTSSAVTIGNAMNSLTLRSGEVYPAVVGKRIIVEATKEKVLFVEASNAQAVPRFFLQTPYGFHLQWLDVIRRDAASKTAGAVTLAEWEVQFLVGVMAGAGWTGLAVVIGVDIFEEALTRKKTRTVQEAVRVLQVLLETRRELSQVAPTLTVVLSDVMWLTLLKGQNDFLLASMAHDPKIAARAAGTIVAQIGKTAVDQRLTVSSAIWILLSQLGIKGILTVPAALSKTVDHISSTDPESILVNIELMLKHLEIVLSHEEKKLILRELESNPEKIAKIFLKMIDELRTSPR